VTLSKDARARALQLPAWNEALGLPRPWDQQWSLRLQQILAYETDLLEYEDLFRGSEVFEAKTREIAEGAWEEMQKVLGMGGAVEAIEYMKSELVGSLARRQRAIESGEITLVGVNRHTETEASPLDVAEGLFEKFDPEAEKRQIAGLEAWRASRDDARAARALDALRSAARGEENLVPASIEAARAGVTTGEWADALRETFGEFRAPTGVGRTAVTRNGHEALEQVRAKVADVARKIGAQRLRMLVGKPGLDGHSNGAEQVAVRARDAGFEVVYQGIRLSPEAIARAAAEEDVHVVGLSILSGGHAMLVPDVLDRMRAHGVDPSKVPVVVGGIIPEADAAKLKAAGVAAVFTPRDFDLTRLMGEIAELVARARSR
ncbi:MAG: methylmalonyl-CoA mutase family protein, partial [Actinomycetota bacterium]